MENENSVLLPCTLETGLTAPFRMLTSPAARRWFVFVCLAVLALVIRLPQLGARPMHTDEAVNAYILGELLAGGVYHYDPRDRHGPALFALAEPLVKLFGARRFSDLSEWQIRLAPVLLGSGTVLLFGAGVEMFGFITCLVAALLFVLAPLPVYYSRYFIHETLLVAATLGLILSGWRAWQKNSPGAAALAGLCAALMLACKETAIIHLFALGLVLFAACLLPPRQKPPSLRLVGVALGVLLFVAILLFTWLGRNWTVFADLFPAITRFSARAGGEGHAKPFGYYIPLLDPMLILCIVAIGGGYAALWDAVHRVRKAPALLVIYGLLISIIYSAIPYKTPWLALNLWLPLALGCGLGVAAFWQQTKNTAGRCALVVVGLLLLATLAAQTRLLAFDHPADEDNPLAYAHTSEDLAGLPPRLEQLAREKSLPQPRIAVVAADAWPLPWYLRKFTRVGYWQPGQDTGPADFYLTITTPSGRLGETLNALRPEFFGVRPGVLLQLWVPAARPATP